MPLMPRVEGLKPFWEAGDARLYHGHVVDVLRQLPAKSVQCTITSPPYWGLRDYGVAGQIGSEATPQEYVETMVEVFREVRRVLRDDGCVWLNLGDTYSGGKTGRADDGSGDATSRLGPKRTGLPNNSGMGPVKQRVQTEGLLSGNMVGIPFRVAFALQADGWVLRQDIVWAKRNSMPESVKNRCTKSHEFVFLLAKSMRYFYDHVAIQDQSFVASVARMEAGFKTSERDDAVADVSIGANARTRLGLRETLKVQPMANKRDVWSVEDNATLLRWLGDNEPAVLERFLAGRGNKADVWRIATQPYPGSHYATFPPNLIRPMVLAGTSEKGACVRCGAPWRRVVDVSASLACQGRGYTAECIGRNDGDRPDTNRGGRRETKGWEPTCCCNVNAVRPCVVLDPFIGSGTTAEVCLHHGRRCWGIDLSEKYLRENAIPRISMALPPVEPTAPKVRKAVFSSAGQREEI